MAKSKPNRTRLTNKWTEQLEFLRRSCDTFDSGFESEAIRIAVSLRVIFHDTKSSTSLISHMGLSNNRILSSARGHGDWKDYLGFRIDLRSPEPIRMIPVLGNVFRTVSIQHWWSKEPVFIHNSQSHSRRGIVLSAADKDGGAHVDEKLEEYYEYLCAGQYAFGITGNLQYEGLPPFPQGVTLYAQNAHLALIRQFAHEVLVSVGHFNWHKNAA